MKVLFLDIDGVLNSSRTVYGLGNFPHGFEEENLKLFDWAAVGLIKSLIKKTGCKVVLSSSWRIIHSIQEVSEGLGIPIMDRTPLFMERSIGRPQRRGDEIEHWLRQHPEVSTYVILDDNSDMLKSQANNFVRTDEDEGLSFANYKKALEILGVGNNEDGV